MPDPGKPIDNEKGQRKPPPDVVQEGSLSGDDASCPGVATGKTSTSSLRDTHNDDDAAETTASLPKSSSQRKPTITPTTDDILMGRGWPYQKHPGNQKMRNLVEEHKPIYNMRSRSGKGDLVKELLRKLRNGGSRFLIRSEEGNHDWEIASKGEAYEKVCHALRGKAKQKTKRSPAAELSTCRSVDADDRAPKSNPSIPTGQPQAHLTMPPNASAGLAINTMTGIRLSMPTIQHANVSSLNHMMSLVGRNPSLPSSMSSFLTTGSQNAASAASDGGTGSQGRNLSDHTANGAAPDTTTSTHETTDQSCTSPSSRTNVESPRNDDMLDDLSDDLHDADPAVRMAISEYLRRKRDA
eukprot:CAMPEP_0117011856 /NCGR_PEP_ID=MMETSP0472-20121206/10107_1 /TAXON_ID=693140 ORGANISM="Tiarina fusus, Strain LIS" /NCGR_SAMPLE_ID=MMETSP0472 /ASSEMBLY_ACC=CAM_ASM_000603 /LENGTH=353 /DNA_ID=CAMNT_0004714785 /DNA_START=55 /DNA_END=1117 /DNA_ORIENTATION=+